MGKVIHIWWLNEFPHFLGVPGCFCHRLDLQGNIGDIEVQYFIQLLEIGSVHCGSARSMSISQSDPTLLSQAVLEDLCQSLCMSMVVFLYIMAVISCYNIMHVYHNIYICTFVFSICMYVTIDTIICKYDHTLIVFCCFLFLFLSKYICVVVVLLGSQQCGWTGVQEFLLLSGLVVAV